MRQPRKLSDLTRYHLQAQDGEIGKLKQIYFDDKDWVVHYFVIHTGTWLTGDDVLIVPSVISTVDEKSHLLKVGLNKEQIQNRLPVDKVFSLSEAEARDSTNPHLRNSEEVKGYRIHALDGEIGHVEDFILEEPDWTVRYLEIDTRDWLPGKKVLIAPAWIQQVDSAQREVMVDLTRESIESAPAYSPAEVISRDYQVALYGHYGKAYHQK